MHKHMQVPGYDDGGRLASMAVRFEGETTTRTFQPLHVTTLNGLRNAREAGGVGTSEMAALAPWVHRSDNCTHEPSPRTV